VATDRITSATRAEVERSLTGRRRDPGETAFSVLLLMTLVVALAVLIVLLLDVARTAVPTLKIAAVRSWATAIRRFRPTRASSKGSSARST
jgi:hypothetical protein